ncbi:hypothetical protein GDO86_010420 [Hymenochirus boettgeri]|uniref:Uncharacterized protein n=1 Tax=Hymenochirus boettgeri TaxID=247094 RepID=A0A8T2JPZ3_9PIPI|nr:hypothetical protein GDO86_010420 [Hymenochirus boettgeri]
MRILFLVMFVLCLSMAIVNAGRPTTEDECSQRGGYCSTDCWGSRVIGYCDTFVCCKG